MALKLKNQNSLLSTNDLTGIKIYFIYNMGSDSA